MESGPAVERDSRLAGHTEKDSDSEGAGDDLEKSAIHSVFLCFYLFTRVDEMDVENWPGKVPNPNPSLA